MTLSQWIDKIVIIIKELGFPIFVAGYFLITASQQMGEIVTTQKQILLILSAICQAQGIDISP